jgi:hypothetical protein
MSKLLRDTIAQLAETFVSGVLSAVRSASLEDLASETGSARPAGRTAAAPKAAAAAPAVKARRGRGGRLKRRTPEDIAQVIEHIVSLLRANANGLRAEEIRAKLGLSAAELPRPINEALASRTITKTGEKRATRYFVGGGGKAAGGGGAKKRGKRGAKKG